MESLLREAAQVVPASSAVVTPHELWSYSRCLQRSEELASGLAARSLRRFGCRVESPGELVSLLAAAARTGSEACIYPANFTDEKLEELARTLGHTTLVSDVAVKFDSIEVLPVAQLVAAGLDTPLPAPSEVATVLILTTGTTGQPKGTIHAWGRLAANIRRTNESNQRWLLTYNLNQFAGLQVLLHCLANRGTVVVPKSNQPPHAVEAMRQHKVTHVSSTPTFWRLVAGKLDALEASKLSLTQITLGGEAPTRGILDALARLFPQARLTQVYAATELGSVIAVSDGVPGLPASVLEKDGCEDVQFRILQGELQVKTKFAMLSYYGVSNSSSGWRPTGDLVELRGERIEFVGRTSEIVNVGGVKVSPLMVEDVVNAVEGVRLARVYGRPNAITGHIVATDVVPDDEADEVALKIAIRKACQLLPPAARPRVITLVDELEIRGQKLIRGQQGRHF
jgi:acyl-coenzyme A synthetase/AMP-(fatty) acid ligase